MKVTLTLIQQSEAGQIVMPFTVTVKKDNMGFAWGSLAATACKYLGIMKRNKAKGFKCSAPVELRLQVGDTLIDLQKPRGYKGPLHFLQSMQMRLKIRPGNAKMELAFFQTAKELVEAILDGTVGMNWDEFVSFKMGEAATQSAARELAREAAATSAN